MPHAKEPDWEKLQPERDTGLDLDSAVVLSAALTQRDLAFVVAAIVRKADDTRRAAHAFAVE